MPVLRQGDPGWKDPFRPKRPKGSKRQRMIARQEARKVINKTIETKRFYGRTAGYVNSDYNGQTINLFTNPATGVNLIQGTDREDYIGDTFRPIGLRLKYQCEALPAAGNYSTWTVLIIQVKGGGTPLPVNVLQSVGNGQTPFSFIDPTFMDTIRVLARRTFTAQNVLAPGNFNRSGMINIKARKLRKVFMQTPLSTATANGLFLVFYSDSAIPANPIQFTWELLFKDA